MKYRKEGIRQIMKKRDKGETKEKVKQEYRCEKLGKRKGKIFVKL